MFIRNATSRACSHAIKHAGCHCCRAERGAAVARFREYRWDVVCVRQPDHCDRVRAPDARTVHRAEHLHKPRRGEMDWANEGPKGSSLSAYVGDTAYFCLRPHRARAVGSPACVVTFHSCRVLTRHCALCTRVARKSLLCVEVGRCGGWWRARLESHPSMLCCCAGYHFTLLWLAIADAVVGIAWASSMFVAPGDTPTFCRVQGCAPA